MPLLGAHESVAGGLNKAFDRITSVGGESLQIFTRNQRQWNAPTLTNDEIETFKKRWQLDNQIQVASHGSYLVNLASSKEDLFVKSINALSKELERCHQLQIPYVILHPGSHGGNGSEAGIDRFVQGIDTVLEQSHPDTLVLIETTAGQGTGLGKSFEEIGSIIDKSKFDHQLGVCFDTCHIFAAGYDIRSSKSYAKTMAQFDRHIGIDRLKFFHLNDSKKELGSRVDRHAHIGEGFIGLDGFTNLLNDPRFKNHPMTLETPKGNDLEKDIENLKVLRGLLKATS